MKIITILSINADGSLNLSDKGMTKASRGEVVQWKIDPKSGVGSITDIQDSSTVDIFSHDPAKDPNPSKWSGTVNPNLKPLPCTEKYTICYTKTGSDEVHRFDPKIQVDS